MYPPFKALKKKFEDSPGCFSDAPRLEQRFASFPGAILSEQEQSMKALFSQISDAIEKKDFINLAMSMIHNSNSQREEIARYLSGLLETLIPELKTLFAKLGSYQENRFVCVHAKKELSSSIEGMIHIMEGNLRQLNTYLEGILLLKDIQQMVRNTFHGQKINIKLENPSFEDIEDILQHGILSLSGEELQKLRLDFSHKGLPPEFLQIIAKGLIRKDTTLHPEMKESLVSLFLTIHANIRNMHEAVMDATADRNAATFTEEAIIQKVVRTLRVVEKLTPMARQYWIEGNSLLERAAPLDTKQYDLSDPNAKDSIKKLLYQLIPWRNNAVLLLPEFSTKETKDVHDTINTMIQSVELRIQEYREAIDETPRTSFSPR